MDINPLATPYIKGIFPAIFVFWHGNLLMIAPICPKVKTHVIISTHHDGEIITRSISRFGIQVIRGSSRHGGRGAALQAIKILRSGGHVAITPDGPRGPHMKVQQGIITLARLANVPVIPVTCSSSRHRLLASWDKFMLVFPFGALCYRVGAPIADPFKEGLETTLIEQMATLAPLTSRYSAIIAARTAIDRRSA
jgi:lysophospholipid acyltransferase (LPLAT)-like uncharacterized protein